MAWIEPKTDWAAPDGVRAEDMNAIGEDLKELYYAQPLMRAANIYISPDGDDDDGDGTESNPYKTIGKGVSVLPIVLNGAAVVLNIATGLYDEDVVISSRGNLIRIQGDGDITMRTLTVEACNVYSTVNLILNGSDNALYIKNGGLLDGINVSCVRAASTTGTGLKIDSNSSLAITGTLTITNYSAPAVISHGSRVSIHSLNVTGGTNNFALNTGSILAVSESVDIFGLDMSADSLLLSTQVQKVLLWESAQPNGTTGGNITINGIDKFQKALVECIFNYSAWSYTCYRITYEVFDVLSNLEQTIIHNVRRNTGMVTYFTDLQKRGTNELNIAGSYIYHNYSGTPHDSSSYASTEVGIKRVWGLTNL